MCAYCGWVTHGHTLALTHTPSRGARVIRSTQIRGEEGAGARGEEMSLLLSLSCSIGNQAAPHYGDAHQFYNAARKVHTNKLLVGSSFVDPKAKDTHQPHGCVRSRSAALGTLPVCLCAFFLFTFLPDIWNICRQPEAASWCWWDRGVWWG